MYYYSMSHEDILNHSRRFINALYKQYIQRACENLGVSSKENTEELSEEDYPDDFGERPSSWREQPRIEVENTQDFMALFDDMGMDKYDKDKIIVDD